MRTTYLTSVEKTMELSIKEMDDKIVKYFTVEPPPRASNVQLIAEMNVLLYRYIFDFFYFLSKAGELVLENNINAYRMLQEIGLDGPKFLQVNMNRTEWDRVAKWYDYHEGEIEEMINTLAAIKLMWTNLKQELEWYLEDRRNKKKKSAKV
jgi:hypothetical protein